MTALLASDVDQEWPGPRCGYGMCRREPEYQLLLEREDGTLEQVLLVCGFHVTPAVVWGRPAPLDVAIRPLSFPS